MKALPKQLTKGKIKELYGNQYNRIFIEQEIKSFQEQLGENIRTKLITEDVKKLFINRFGLPTGYQLVE
jgi:hypothetical protein